MQLPLLAEIKPSYCSFYNSFDLKQRCQRQQDLKKRLQLGACIKKDYHAWHLPALPINNMEVRH